MNNRARPVVVAAAGALLLLLAGCDGVSGLMAAVEENWRIVDEGTFDPPTTPANLTAILTSDGILLGWDASERAASYEIEVRFLTNFAFLNNATTTQYLHADLEPDRVYDYRVRALNESANPSDWSEIVSVSTGGWEPAASATLRAKPADRAAAATKSMARPGAE